MTARDARESAVKWPDDVPLEFGILRNYVYHLPFPAPVRDGDPLRTKVCPLCDGAGWFAPIPEPLTCCGCMGTGRVHANFYTDHCPSLNAQLVDAST